MTEWQPSLSWASSKDDNEFNITPWATGILLICLLPLFLLALDVDFSSGHPPLSPELAGQ